MLDITVGTALILGGLWIALRAITKWQPLDSTNERMKKVLRNK
jgi:hypothetical protein